jgi:non-homologous end joining protein Ku
LIACRLHRWTWSRYRDTSAEELAASIEVKWAQQPPPGVQEETVVLKLLDALKQSVAAVREEAAPPKAPAAGPQDHGTRALPTLAVAAESFAPAA